MCCSGPITATVSDVQVWLALYLCLKICRCFRCRKRDCLHRFVVVLCERGERLELVEYPYVDLLEEVILVS